METTALGPTTITKIRTYIDEGVDLHTLGLSQSQIDRVLAAERCYERLQQDPWLDTKRYLMRVEGRSRQQVVLDLQVVDIFMSTLNQISRQLLEHRRDVTLHRLARGAEQTGDLKMQERVLTHIEKQISELGEEKDDAIKNTAALPGVLVPVEFVDPSKQSLGDRAFIALLKKYNGKQDQIDQWTTERKEAMLIDTEQESPEARIARLERELAEARAARQPVPLYSPEDEAPQSAMTFDNYDIMQSANQFMDNGDD